MRVSTRNRMSEKPSKERLVGAWALTSYVVRDIKTGVEDRPFGERPLELLLYTPDGYMSAQLQRPERPLFADGDLTHAAPDEFAAAGTPTSPIQVAFLSTNRRTPCATKWQ
jgi:hypothetical protein